MNQRILDYIPRGKENAIPAQRLAEITGARSVRGLRADIADLRTAGAIICSGKEGYYRPATRAEITDFIRSMESHAKSVYKAIQSARASLREMEGQQRLENI